eukprot:CAMPEP_0182883598 /NCGR_PEP_ID=MMETSP0034_2-20130328/18476_1 /TAXON_ID=156128 /ORGANISM="Nephroselmis pyriformis, Strain CCMP717" /LENGTH=92 /DNA_ID=CAMNT_0025016741 /DNA_START=105 /DNA_END=380 /DNA_ORIENTATION=+
MAIDSARHCGASPAASMRSSSASDASQRRPFRRACSAEVYARALGRRPAPSISPRRARARSQRPVPPSWRGTTAPVSASITPPRAQESSSET